MNNQQERIQYLKSEIKRLNKMIDNFEDKESEEYKEATRYAMQHWPSEWQEAISYVISSSKTVIEVKINQYQTKLDTLTKI